MAEAAAPVLSEEEILQVLKDSEDFVENELSSIRQNVWMYYNGSIKTAAKKNRSNIVKTEVRDTVEMLMPPLMMAYMASDYLVEFFAPKSAPPELHKFAAETTQQINEVFFNDNPWWEILHDATKDALLSRSVFFKVYREDEETSYEKEYDTKDEFAGDQLKADGYELVDGKAVKKDTVKKVRIEVIPPEQGLIDRDAKCSKTALLIGQKSTLRRMDLYGMGFDKKTIDELPAEDDSTLSEEEQARTGYSSDPASSSIKTMLDRIVLREFVIREGEKRYKVFSTKDKVLRKEEIRDYENPYVVFSAIRIPHTAVGRAPAESIIPLQEFGSVLFRQVFDNLYWTNMPALGVLRNSVNPFQVQNWSFGTVFDVKVPDAIKPITIPFVADKTVPFLDWLEKQREQRSGVYKDALGLNPEAMQGQTATAAQGAMTAAQRQVEMYARNICEFGFVPVFRLVFMLMNEQAPPFNLRTKVGLGAGTREERFRQLSVIADRQEKVLGTMGPQNPLVTPQRYGNTLRELGKLSTYYSEDLFVNPPEEVEQRIQQLAQQPPKPDPEMLKVQAEMQKNQQKAQIDQQKAQMDMATAQQEMQLKQQNAQLELQIMREKAMMEMQIAREKAQNDIQIAQMKAEDDMRRKQQELALQTHLEAAKIKADERSGQGNINMSEGT